MTTDPAAVLDAPMRAPSPLRAHLPALDGVRGVAILLVLYAHFTATEPAGAALNVFERIYFRSAQLGWWGVDLFFVLSGFLITGILYDAKGKEHYFRNFYMRRVLRIFPLYYGVLLLVFVVIPLARTPHSLDDQTAVHSSLWLWCYAANIGMCVHDAVMNYSHTLEFNHFWSLAVEEHFYFVWPLLVHAFGRQSLVRICGAIIVGALGLRWMMLELDIHWMKRFFLTPCRMDALAMGALLALLVRGDYGLARLVKGARWIAMVGGLILGGVILSNAYPEALCGGKVWDTYFLQQDQAPGSDWMSWFLHVGLLSVLAAVFGATLLLAVHARSLGHGNGFGQLGSRRMLSSAFGADLHDAKSMLHRCGFLPWPRLLGQAGPLLGSGTHASCVVSGSTAMASMSSTRSSPSMPGPVHAM